MAAALSLGPLVHQQKIVPPVQDGPGAAAEVPEAGGPVAVEADGQGRPLPARIIPAGEPKPVPGADGDDLARLRRHGPDHADGSLPVGEILLLRGVIVYIVLPLLRGIKAHPPGDKADEQHQDRRCRRQDPQHSLIPPLSRPPEPLTGPGPLDIILLSFLSTRK